MAALLLEIVGELTAKQIVQFIGKAVANKTVGWLTDKALKEIFGDKSTDKSAEIIQKLESIKTDLENMRKDLENISIEIKWEHLTSRIFQAEIDICHKFDLLISVLSIKDSTERRNEFESLRTGILDINSGVLSNMYLIHRVLIGRAVLNPAEKGLLEMWSEGVYNHMLQNQMSANAYKTNAEKYLHKSAILQLKGFILFWVGTGSLKFFVGQASMVLENLKYQAKFSEELLPPALTHLTNPDETQLFVLSASNNNVVYESLPTTPKPGKIREMMTFFGMGYSASSDIETERNELILRKRSENNEDEEWVFVKSHTFDGDGSLRILKNPGKNSKYGRRYMFVSENMPYCCEEHDFMSDTFVVMPLQTTDKHMKIIIYSSGNGYLGHSKNKLAFSSTFSGDNIEFTMIPTKHPDYQITC